MDRREWQNLYTGVGKRDIMEHYGDPQFPVQLRMFAELVLGRGPDGADSTAFPAQLESKSQPSRPSRASTSTAMNLATELRTPSNPCIAEKTIPSFGSANRRQLTWVQYRHPPQEGHLCCHCGISAWRTETPGAFLRKGWAKIE
jgi:hypothetical protein